MGVLVMYHIIFVLNGTVCVFSYGIVSFFCGMESHGVVVRYLTILASNGIVRMFL